MGTKRELIDDPNSPLNHAADDEEVFLIRAQDMLSEQAVSYWAFLAWANGAEEAKVREAQACARRMAIHLPKKVPD